MKRLMLSNTTHNAMPVLQELLSEWEISKEVLILPMSSMIKLLSLKLLEYVKVWSNGLRLLNFIKKVNLLKKLPQYTS